MTVDLIFEYFNSAVRPFRPSEWMCASDAHILKCRLCSHKIYSTLNVEFVYELQRVAGCCRVLQGVEVAL